jgi:catechol 2,3-dioxygenase-like lactoylglutathione lyase family enzyme
VRKLKAKTKSKAKKAKTAPPTPPVFERGLSGAKVMAFAATANPKRARVFYEDKLGLRLLSADEFALAFDANGTTLRVQIVEKVAAAGYTALGWTVADIAETVRTLTSAGISFERYAWMKHDDLGVWSAPSGAKVAWFKDPDGNTLSLTEL